ncbi:MAG: sensor histidine kinase [Actinobacteria bacterium]|nr:sensor histidine kinase [Actinomycetota bacterium]
MSIRSRFLIVICAIMLATIAVLSVSSYVLTSRFLMSEVDQNLDNRVTIISEILQSQPRDLRGRNRVRNPLANALLPTRFDSITQVITDDGSVLVGFGEVDLPVSKDVLEIANNSQLARVRESFEIEGVKYRMLSVPIRQGGALQIAIDVADIERAKQAIQRGGLLLALFGMLGSATIAWFSAGRVSRPIKDLADAAEQIARTGNLDVEVAIDGDSEIKQLTSSFNSMTAALRSSREQQKQLVQDASHELRTPLTSLRANSELLQRSDLDENARVEILRDIRTEVDELTLLSSELSALATDQKLSEIVAKVDLGPLVEEVVSRARRRYSRDISLSINDSATVDLRQSQFDRALSNLIDNAVKFSPVETAIEVVVDSNRIEIVDHGPGVAASDKSRIFERFYRSTSTRSLPGSGLGLAIVKQFVDDHDAKIEVTDTPGGGATMVIQFKE